MSSAQVPGGGLRNGVFPMGCSRSLGTFDVALAHAELRGMRLEGEELETVDVGSHWWCCPPRAEAAHERLESASL